MMKRIVLSVCAAVAAAVSAWGAEIYVAPGGTGAGTSWADAASVSAAFAAAGENDVIYLKEGAYGLSDVTASGLVLTNAVTVKGGYAGEGTPGARAADALSTLDGEDVAPTVLTLSATVGTYDFSQLAIRRGTTHGIDKTGAASSLAMADCQIVENGIRVREGGWLNGRGAQLKGNATSELTIRNCLFGGNCKTNTAANASGTPSYPNKKGFKGGALYLSGFRRATVDDCLFVTNGVAFHVVPSGNYCCEDNGGFGAAIFADALPLVVRGCRFVGNRSAGRTTFSPSGSIVVFNGNCAGSAISNCQFVANVETRCHPSAGQGAKYGGTVLVLLDTVARSVDVVNCTFAGNLMDSVYSPGGLQAVKGTARIRNCIFAGTIRGTDFNGSASASHLRAEANGVLDVAYCVFDEPQADSIFSVPAGVLRLGPGLQFGVDPRFVTPCSVLSGCVWADGIHRMFDYREPTTIATLLAFDAHLTNTAWAYSRAIDAGDPAMSVGDEPSPNGGCLNAGAYAGTAAATTSADGAAAFDGPIAVAWEDGASKPQFSVRMAGATEGALYNARVRILVGTESGVWGWTNETSGVQSGDTASYVVPEFFLKGDTLFVRAEASVYGKETVSLEQSFEVTVDPPPSYRKGGGPTVVHVWADAPGNQTGEDWMNAFHTVDQAVAAAGASAFEQIWIAGTLAHNTLFNSWARAADILVLGGFSGVENSPEERAPGAYATLDGQNASPAFKFANTAGTITFRDLAFTRTSGGALSKSGGAGHLSVTNCLFYGNRSAAGNASGNCLHLVGVSGQSEVSVQNCRMEGNAAEDYVSGIAVTIYAKTLKRLTLDNCLFATNTASIRCGGGSNCPGRDGLKGSEIYAIGAPLTARNCKFLVNRGCTRNANSAGGNIRLEGASAPSAFTNCLFAGNSCQYAWGSGLGASTNMTGTLLIDLATASDTVDFASCTFAYNVTAGAYAPGAMEVNRGSVNVVNSIFYGNVKSLTSPAGRDIDAQPGQASVTVSHSCFQNLCADCLTGPVTLGEGVFACADPYFVTSHATVSSVMSGLSGDYVAYQNNADAVTVLSALDLHLRTVAGYCRNDGTWTEDPAEISPAIDKGDPAVPCTEPLPNGDRMNLGCYGNTAEASHTLVSEPPSLPDENITIDFPDGYSQPLVTVTPTGGERTKFDATVIVEFLTNGLVAVSGTVEHVIKDMPATVRSSVGFVAGETLTVRVTVKTDGNDDVVVEQSKTVEGELPPWNGGKGGGPEIIHVRAGANGAKDGTSWQDAFDSLAAAVLAVGTGTREVWIAGDFTNDATLVFSVAAGATVRGGFRASECTVAERPAGTVTVLDGQRNVNEVVKLSGNGQYHLDRLCIRRAKQHGVSKSGNGDLTLSDCALESNGDAVSKTCDGRGLYMSGNGKAHLAATNVMVSGNGECATTFVAYALGGYGAGMYLTGVARAEIDDCLFATNGCPAAVQYGTQNGVDLARGAAIHAVNSPIAVRHTRFVGNSAVSRNGGSYINGGIVRLEGASGGSAFTNCLWSGNHETRCWNSADSLGAGSGGLVLMLANAADRVDVVNCTFAYNVVWGSDSPGGVNVYKGTANVLNSIFYGNRLNTNTWGTNGRNKSGTDISVKQDGRLTLAYSLLANSTTSCVTAVEGTLESLHDMVYGDPLFVSTTNDFASLLAGTAVLPSFKTDLATRDATTQFNLHVRGRLGYTDELTGELVAYRRAASPAIDTGDPRSPWRREPSPNGRRVNLGFYGNTPYATRTGKMGTLVIIK